MPRQKWRGTFIKQLHKGMITEMNKIIIIGYLGNNPKMAKSAKGTAICRFRIASNQHHTKTDGSTMQKTEWFSCSAFSAVAQRCNQMLRRGRPAYVEGILSTSSYIDRDGNQQQGLNVVVQEFFALGPKESIPTTADFTTEPVAA